jgi:hypothetical protein
VHQLVNACRRDGLRGLYRHLYWWQDDRRRLAPLADIRTAVAFGESLGDNLLCATVLAKLHAAGDGPLAMFTPYPDLFAGLPFPIRCLPFDSGTLAALSRRGPRLLLPSYGRYQPALDRHVPTPRDHLIAELCRSVGLQGEVELKPLLQLTAAERRAGGMHGANLILIQSSNQGARMAAANKEWLPGRWQQTVNALRPSYRIAQIGPATDPALSGTEDFRGRFSLRELAAVMASARLFVGGEGFLMHLARAVDCRAVIVLGGRTAPNQTCYRENANLYTPLPCAPCWRTNTCDFGRECLARISVDDVLSAIETQLKLPRLGAGERVSL